MCGTEQYIWTNTTNTTVFPTLSTHIATTVAWHAAKLEHMQHT